MEELLYWDKEILVYFNNLGNKTYDVYWLWLTNQSHWLFLYFFTAVLYVYFMGWKKGLATLALVLVLLGFCNETTDFFKAYFHRIRPSSASDMIVRIRDLMHPRNGSFISGHASNSTLFVWSSIYVLEKYTKYIYILLIWWVLFLYSRIYVGVHYPSDIIFGMLWGFFILIIGKKLMKILYHKIGIV